LRKAPVLDEGSGVVWGVRVRSRDPERSCRRHRGESEALTEIVCVFLFALMRNL
jgi:hypothetical protein